MASTLTAARFAPRRHEAERPATAGPGHRRLALVLILTAAFMVVLDFSIVNVALASIEREFGFSATAVQWIVTGYAIAFGGLLILGAGAADVAPSALSLITTGFAEGPARTRALGMYGATASIGFVAGQVLGGVLVEFTSWRAVFLVNVPVGIVALLLAPKLLGESRQAPGGGHSLDIGGALLITGAVAALVFAVSQGYVLGWASPAVLGAVVAAAAAGAAFVAVERRHPQPLVRGDLVRRPSLRKAGTMNLLLGLWNAGELIVLSLYFQQVLHDSPLSTGLAIAPQGVIGFMAGAFGARLARRIGIRRVLILTSALATVGFLVLTRLPAAGGYSPLLTAVMLVGFGTAGTAFGTMVTASAGVGDDDQGLVGGVINTSRQVGAAIGAALLPAIAEAVSHGSPAAAVSGDRTAMLIAAVAAALATVVACGGLAAHPRLRLRHTS